MKNFKKGAIAAVAMAASLVASVALAGPVTLWNYSVLTQFTGSNVFTTGSGGTQFQTATQVTWGNGPNGDVFVPGSGRSGITIADTAPGANDPTATPITGTVTTNAVSIPGIGLAAWITHHNNPISADTLLRSQIASTLTLTPNTPATPFATIGPSTLDFNIYFAETPNSTPCTAPSPAGNPCNDIFALNANEVFNQSFSFNGFTYFVSTFPIAGNGLTTFQPLTAAECAATGANAGCVGFTTVEGQSTTVQFGFAITQQPVAVVPEPGSLALVGLALAAFGLRRRKLH